MADEEYSMVLKAAWYYYMENYTQQQISEMMGVSRTKVIRLIEEAHTRGTIQFLFRPNDQENMEIEKGIIDKFGLKDAYVIPTPQPNSDLRESIAKAAAMYVSNNLKDDGYLNIGYGDTMGLLLKFLATSGKNKLNVVSLTGGVSYYLPTITSELFGMKLYLTPAPLIVSKPELRELLLQEGPIKDIYTMSKHADMSVVGIGATEDGATILRNNIVDKTEFALLKMQGAVGDVLTHFYDKDGQDITSDLDTRVISTSLEDLVQMKNVVGVAAGESKVTAIYAALMRGFLDVLVTDANTARHLLEYSQ